MEALLLIVGLLATIYLIIWWLARTTPIGFKMEILGENIPENYDFLTLGAREFAHAKTSGSSFGLHQHEGISYEVLIRAMSEQSTMLVILRSIPVWPWQWPKCRTYLVPFSYKQRNDDGLYEWGEAGFGQNIDVFDILTQYHYA